ncbi:MAG TPA: proteasome-type protease [Pararobbsia sp.]|nr:proteasome-type protease [Pararobbsia sp.]
MTYCVAMRVNDGLVFLSDTRTNAGVDQISTFRKMSVFENPGERVIVLMSAGNLAISQAVAQALCEPADASASSLWNVDTMHDAARVVGDAVREVYQRDAESLQQFGVEFNCSFIVGGQIGTQSMRVFQVYSAGNFIEASSVNPYLQIGEAKYGKPIIDRVLTPRTPLDEAAKCALISMDSTLRSNLSVGLPLDLLVYERDTLKVTRFVSMDHDNEYFQMIHSTWGARLRQVFSEIHDPEWSAIAALPSASDAALPPRAAWPGVAHEPLAIQSVAQARARSQGPA